MILDVLEGFLFLTLLMAGLAIAIGLWSIAVFAIWNLA